MSNGSTVNICALDISKAFDKINAHCLLLKLMKRRIPINFIVIFERWFNSIFVKVRWGQSLSSFYRFLSGIRQGGILSPCLFSIYIDDVISQIQDKKLGCFVHGLFCGIWLYADDIVLVSASVTELQCMIDICVSEIQNIDLSINVSKSKCVRIGRRYKIKLDHVKIGGCSIDWCDQIRYLGIFIVAGRNFKCNLHENKSNFFKAANCILSKVGTNNVAVLMSLVVTKCISLLTYGLTSVSLKNYEKSKLDNCLDLFMAKVFGTYNKNILRQCLYYTGYLPISLFVDLAKMRFMKSFENLSDVNSLLFYFFADNNMNELNELLYNYHVLENDNNAVMKNKVWTFFAKTI